MLSTSGEPFQQNRVSNPISVVLELCIYGIYTDSNKFEGTENTHGKNTFFQVDAHPYHSYQNFDH